MPSQHGTQQEKQGTSVNEFIPETLFFRDLSAWMTPGDLRRPQPQPNRRVSPKDPGAHWILCNRFCRECLTKCEILTPWRPEFVFGFPSHEVSPQVSFSTFQLFHTWRAFETYMPLPTLVFVSVFLSFCFMLLC